MSDIFSEYANRDATDLGEERGASHICLISSHSISFHFILSYLIQVARISYERPEFPRIFPKVLYADIIFHIKIE
jgi:hypothetical protein